MQIDKTTNRLNYWFCIQFYTSVRGAAVHMYRNEGWQCFYRGLFPSLVQTAPYSGLQFGSYSIFSYLWKKIFEEGIIIIIYLMTTRN